MYNPCKEFRLYFISGVSNIEDCTVYWLTMLENESDQVSTRFFGGLWGYRRVIGFRGSGFRVWGVGV